MTSQDNAPAQSAVVTAGALVPWVAALAHLARRYQLDYSAGTLEAAARWQQDKTLDEALSNLSRLAGLRGGILAGEHGDLSLWRLPLVVQFTDGQVGIIESYDGEDSVGVRLMRDNALINTLAFSALLPQILYVAAFRPAAIQLDDSGEEGAPWHPDWLRRTILRRLKPWWHVMLASLIVNVLALAGIIFSMQVYDRVIPAQSFPTLYVLFIGVLIAVAFSFGLRLLRSHITDLLGKQADIRVSNRVFSHALRLRSSAVPRSTGNFISQVRDLEQIREMVTSTTVSVIVDMPFFLLFLLVLAIVSPQLAWIAPAAALLMVIPGLLLQKKLAALARQSTEESTRRNAVLVESLQGLEDIKLLQAENRFTQQWDRDIRVAAQSGVRTRKLTQGLVAWGMTIQNLVYASVVVIGAPQVIEGNMTTGAMVAASLLSSRMISPITALCGVLARWQQVKAAKLSLDELMKLPVENGAEDKKVRRAVLYGHYQFNDAVFQYRADSGQPPLHIARLEIQPGERVAVLGRNGAGKSTLLQAMIGGVTLSSGELRLDALSLPHIDVADVRRNIGLMTQNARLFCGTLRDNLTMGAPQASDDEIFHALEVCAATDFIRRLPQGLNHQVMEGGTGLSGGQRQSILLTRMLLRDPNIVLLDEPTASLDEHTERDFILRLKAWLAGRTLVVATHRAAVLELVDRVLVLKDGALAMDAPKEKAVNRAAGASERQEAANES